jgi:hypothetical protein
VLLRLLALVRVPIQLAEAEVAVGNELAHAQIARYPYGLAAGLFRVWIAKEST